MPDNLSQISDCAATVERLLRRVFVEICNIIYAKIRNFWSGMGTKLLYLQNKGDQYFFLFLMSPGDILAWQITESSRRVS
jgi:hypothetical protein